MSDEFTIGSPLRAGIGVVLMTSAAVVLFISRTVDWGVAWTAVIPAVVLLIPAWSLLQRRTLSMSGEHLTITTGWLWRRALVLKITNTELELLPTAGLMAVVLHRGTTAHPLATFVTNNTALRLATWLDQHHLNGGFPRVQPQVPEADR